MRFGINCPIREAPVLAKYGYDYLEAGFSDLVKPTDEAFAASAALLRQSGICCEAANCFIGGEMPLTVQNPAYAELSDYIETGMRRGAAIGLQTVVFGSGGARKVQEDGNYGDAYRKLCFFLREIVSPIAKKYGVCIAIEPLQKRSCNILHTVQEGLLLASLTERDNIFVLADNFHMAVEGDDFENIRLARGWLHHAHISNPNLGGKGNRYPLAEEEYDYRGFLDALRFAGCTRCSIEAHTDDIEADAARSIYLLHACIK